jgi:hypothetical protein
MDPDPFRRGALGAPRRHEPQAPLTIAGVIRTTIKFAVVLGLALLGGLFAQWWQGYLRLPWQ